MSVSTVLRVLFVSPARLTGADQCRGTLPPILRACDRDLGHRLDAALHIDRPGYPGRRHPCDKSDRFYAIGCDVHQVFLSAFHRSANRAGEEPRERVAGLIHRRLRVKPRRPRNFAPRKDIGSLPDSRRSASPSISVNRAPSPIHPKHTLWVRIRRPGSRQKAIRAIEVLAFS